MGHSTTLYKYPPLPSALATPVERLPYSRTGFYSPSAVSRERGTVIGGLRGTEAGLGYLFLFALTLTGYPLPHDLRCPARESTEACMVSDYPNESL